MLSTTFFLWKQLIIEFFSIKVSIDNRKWSYRELWDKGSISVLYNKVVVDYIFTHIATIENFFNRPSVIDHFWYEKFMFEQRSACYRQIICEKVVIDNSSMRTSSYRQYLVRKGWYRKFFYADKLLSQTFLCGQVGIDNFSMPKICYRILTRFI